MLVHREGVELDPAVTLAVGLGALEVDLVVERGELLRVELGHLPYEGEGRVRRTQLLGRTEGMLARADEEEEEEEEVENDDDDDDDEVAARLDTLRS